MTKNTILFVITTTVIQTSQMQFPIHNQLVEKKQPTVSVAELSLLGVFP
jgi:hypothetical protein